MSAEEARALLRTVGTVAGDILPIAEAGLALAQFDRPGVRPDRYHAHLATLAAETEESGPAPTAAARAAALADILHSRHGYGGDTRTYDDLQNANLMRVIDRKKGLPVALAILYMHAARAQGWTIAGLNFPGHFLLQLDGSSDRAVVDPFNDGRSLGASDLRALLKTVAGERAELKPDHYVTVPDRMILLRLQNNIKLRLMKQKDWAGAAAVLDRMLLFAPAMTGLWREAGLVHVEAGNLQAAIDALERYISEEPADRPRHEAAQVLQSIRRRLN